jgi:hypothetical protein
MEERDSGAYKFVAKVTQMGTWWSSRGIIKGEEVWMLDKDPKTGQVNCFDGVWGSPVECRGSGQDGELRTGSPV